MLLPRSMVRIGLLIAFVVFSAAPLAEAAKADSVKAIDDLDIANVTTNELIPMLTKLTPLEKKALDLNTANEVTKSEKKKEIEAATNQFKGFGPGVGISVAFYWGDNKPVKSAAVVNGVVRVTEETTIATSIMFETHYFWTAGNDSTYGYGPYAGVLSSTENVIDAFSLGIMVSKRRNPKESKSFNVGLGAVVNAQAQVLGDDIFENQPLPSGETTIRYKTKSIWGIQILASFHF